MSKLSNFNIDKLRNTSPDIINLRVETNMPGVEGWMAHICYNTGKCSVFTIDQGNATDEEMEDLTRDAILKQLQHHEDLKAKVSNDD